MRAAAIPFDDEFASPNTSSSSDPATVVHWGVHPTYARITQPFHGHFRPPDVTTEWQSMNNDVYDSEIPIAARHDQNVIRDSRSEATASEESLDMESGPPTPRTDDTPYIRFAIDQLTRDEEIRKLQGPETGSSRDSYPVERIIPDLGLRYAVPTQREFGPIRHNRNSSGNSKLFKFNATAPLSPPSSYASGGNRTSNDRPRYESKFIPVEPRFNTARYHDLTFIPMILRPLSMIILTLMTLLMTAALMFCAIYSSSHDGLLARYAGIYGGQYFVFGILPQVLAAILFLWIQHVMSTVTRITPFMMMARSAPNAMFQTLYPSSLIWPRWSGVPLLGLCNLLLCLSVFTIPLQSCLFSVIFVDGVWRWTAVRGVAWTLASIYILIALATITTAVIFFRACTGLRWDPRSLADIMALLPRSNCLSDFGDTDTLSCKTEIKHKLGPRSDRLGYWHTSNNSQSVFYCIGEEYSSSRRRTGDGMKWQRSFERAGSDRLSRSVRDREDVFGDIARFRHIPWYLRDSSVILWAVAGTILLIALILVSFLPSTAIRKGFLPAVGVAPDVAGFSPANFLYSFVPSMLGQMLFLAFRTVDMTIRKLQPWAELSKPDGSLAGESLLLDYHASFTLECFLKATRARHYRVAILSLSSFLFILLPVLAGGFLFPLTTPDNVVRMIPNLPSLHIIIGLLVLYLCGLFAVIPNRRNMHLPHGVDCLAEVISFMYGSKMVDDAIFRSLRSRVDMVTRLLARDRDQVTYNFGIHRGRHGREWLGIDRPERKSVSEMIFMNSEQWV